MAKKKNLMVGGSVGALAGIILAPGMIAKEQEAGVSGKKFIGFNILLIAVTGYSAVTLNSQLLAALTGSALSSLASRMTLIQKTEPKELVL